MALDLGVHVRIHAQGAAGDDLSLPCDSFGDHVWPLSDSGAGDSEGIGGLDLTAKVLDDVCLSHDAGMYNTLSTAVKHSNAQFPDTEQMQTMAERIRVLREAQGMSQTELAKLVGVSRGGVAQWELGLVQNIRLQAFLRLCEALRTDPQYLIFGTDRGRAPSRRRAGTD